MYYLVLVFFFFPIHATTLHEELNHQAAAFVDNEKSLSTNELIAETTGETLLKLTENTSEPVDHNVEMHTNQKILQNIAAYTLYSAQKLENESLTQAQLLEILEQKGFTCSQELLTQFEAHYSSLFKVIDTRTNATLITYLNTQNTIKESIEQAVSKGASVDVIHQSLMRHFGKEVVSVEQITQIAEQAQQKYAGWFSHNQLPIDNISQLIRSSKHPADLTEFYQYITQHTSSPLEQYKALERYEQQLELQKFNITEPTENLASYQGNFPESIAQYLDQKIQPQKYPHALQEKSDGILLIGEPGTGKTFTARIIAKTLNAGLLEINTSQLLEGIIGASEKKLEQYIQAAETYIKINNKPCLIFFDEIDSIGRKRTERGMEHIQTTLNRLLSLVEQKSGNQKLIFVAATNAEPSLLDGALIRKGRFGIHVEFKLPETGKRKEYLSGYLRRYAPNFEQHDKEINQLASLTTNFSQADLKGTVTGALKASCFQSKALSYKDLLHEVDKLQKIKTKQKQTPKNNQ